MITTATATSQEGSRPVDGSAAPASGRTLLPIVDSVVAAGVLDGETVVGGASVVLAVMGVVVLAAVVVVVATVVGLVVVEVVVVVVGHGRRRRCRRGGTVVGVVVVVVSESGSKVTSIEPGPRPSAGRPGATSTSEVVGLSVKKLSAAETLAV